MLVRLHSTQYQPSGFDAHRRADLDAERLSIACICVRTSADVQDIMICKVCDGGTAKFSHAVCFVPCIASVLAMQVFQQAKRRRFHDHLPCCAHRPDSIATWRNISGAAHPTHSPKVQILMHGPNRYFAQCSARNIFEGNIFCTCSWATW